MTPGHQVQFGAEDAHDRRLVEGRLPLDHANQGPGLVVMMDHRYQRGPVTLIPMSR